jgi:hypothetical protein
MSKKKMSEKERKKERKRNKERKNLRGCTAIAITEMNNIL